MAMVRSGSLAIILLALPALLGAYTPPFDCLDQYEVGDTWVDPATQPEPQVSAGWTQERWQEAARMYREWYYHTTTQPALLSSTTYTVTVTAASEEVAALAKGAVTSVNVAVAAGSSATDNQVSPYWSETKRKWCCLYESTGCTSSSTATSTSTSTSTTALPEPFDCEAGFNHWENVWFSAKKTWCCKHKGLGCESTTTSPSTSSSTMRYECAAGDSEKDWSAAQKEWCCKHEGVSCTSTTRAPQPREPGYDCKEDAGSWEAKWSDEKKEWCCKHGGHHCPTTTVLPFDCRAGYENWENGWSANKKVWCCSHEGRGCTTLAATSTTPTTTPSTTPFASHVSTSPRTLVPARDVLTCNLHCFGPGAKPVPLPGSLGQGAGASLNGVTVEQCREACSSTDGCEAVLFTNKTQGVPFYSMCFGKRDVHTSRCQPGGNFVTEMIGGARPWGKCAIFGDPHILPWDRVYGPAVTQTNPGEFYLLKSEELEIHGRFGYTKRFPTASSTTGIAVGGDVIKGHTLVVAWIGPEQGYKGFRVFWDGKPILSEYPSKFTSDDSVLTATHHAMDPTDYHREGRHTIGGTKGDLPSYYFSFSADLNIYVLIGPDNCNVVIETRKTRGEQDGYCGNFNCDIQDDALDKLMLRGAADPIPKHKSLFRFGKPAPAWTMKFRGPAPSIKNCDPAVKKRAEKECQKMSGGKKMIHTCIFDACAAADASVGPDDVGLTKVEALPYNCHVGPSSTWDQDETEWCCQRKGLGCEVSGASIRQRMAFKKLYEAPGAAVDVYASGRNLTFLGVAGLALFVGLVVFRFRVAPEARNVDLASLVASSLAVDPEAALE